MKPFSWYNKRGAPSISVSLCSSLLSILAEPTWFPALLPNEPPLCCACSLSLACLTHVIESYNTRLEGITRFNCLVPSGEHFLMGGPRHQEVPPPGHQQHGYSSHFGSFLVVLLHGICASEPPCHSGFVSSSITHT